MYVSKNKHTINALKITPESPWQDQTHYCLLCSKERNGKLQARKEIGIKMQAGRVRMEETAGTMRTKAANCLATV